MLLITKLTYSISQRWIKCEYYVLMAWGDKRHEKTEVLGEKPLWVPFCPHKSHRDWPETEPMSLWWQASDKSHVPRHRTQLRSAWQLIYVHSSLLWCDAASCGVWFLKLQTVVVASRSSGLKTGLYMYTGQWLLWQAWPCGYRHYRPLEQQELHTHQEGVHRILKSSATALAEPNLTSHGYWFNFFTLPSSVSHHL